MQPNDAALADVAPATAGARAPALLGRQLGRETADPGRGQGVWPVARNGEPQLAMNPSGEHIQNSAPTIRYHPYRLCATAP